MKRDRLQIRSRTSPRLAPAILAVLATVHAGAASSSVGPLASEALRVIETSDPDFVGPVMVSEPARAEPAAPTAKAFASAPGAPLSDAVSLVMGGSTVVKTQGRVSMVVVAHPAVADARPVSPEEIIVIGKTVGQTDLVLRLEDGSSVTRRISVGLNSAELQNRLKRIFGVELQADDVGGAISLRGNVPDVGTGALVKNYMDASGTKWVDLTRITGLRQVQLRVRIAEASRQALRELAFGAVVGGSSFFGGMQAPGAGTPFQQVSIAPGAGAAQTATLAGPATQASTVTSPNFGFNSIPVSSATTLFGGVPGADLEFYIQALVQNSYVRLLAEPNLVAISGQQATFLVGGEFPIPVVQGMNGGVGNAVTIEYKDYGIRLNFRPEVLGDGRIRLEVAPEVSELSTIGSVKQAGFEVPSIIVRRSKTTVELGNGQSFAMAGLLRTKDQARVAKIPVLGDIPVFGALFRSVRYEQDQTELVVMVTADLVEPLDDGMDRPMPGDLHQTPNDWELFMEGRMSGNTDLGTLTRLKALGLTGLRGPGAWRRSDEPRRPAADPMPEGVAEEAVADAEPSSETAADPAPATPPEELPAP
jgi:pilus assembly protein CpaC